MLAADENEPLVLADGRKINPANGYVIKDKVSRGGFIEIPSAGEAVAIVAKSRRAVAEMPVPPSQMNVISLVLFYSMWGLNDQDIATTIGNISTQQVKTIKTLPEYKGLSDDILKNVLEFESNDIRTYMQQNAKRAAEKIIDLVEEDGALGFAASKDVLDRAGYRPADVIEHKHKFEDSLKIEYISKSNKDEIPAVEINAEYRDITPEKF